MPSAALGAFNNALTEIADLRRADRSNALRTPASLRIARVLGRASVVLLSAHFERYFYTVNEEAVLFVGKQPIARTSLPLNLRLLHSRIPVDELAKTFWGNREAELLDFLTKDGWLWTDTLAGSLNADRLLAWMRTPRPAEILRYYQYWGIDDIFDAITRSKQVRSRLWLGVQELVDKRNNIAHGDFNAQATSADIQRYIDSVRMFCPRADRRMAQVLSNLTGVAPW